MKEPLAAVYPTFVIDGFTNVTQPNPAVCVSVKESPPTAITAVRGAPVAFTLALHEKSPSPLAGPPFVIVSHAGAPNAVQVHDGLVEVTSTHPDAAFEFVEIPAGETPMTHPAPDACARV